jgi:hypothetical protein
MVAPPSVRLTSMTVRAWMLRRTKARPREGVVVEDEVAHADLAVDLPAQPEVGEPLDARRALDVEVVKDGDREIEGAIEGREVHAGGRRHGALFIDVEVHLPTDRGGLHDVEAATQGAEVVGDAGRVVVLEGAHAASVDGDGPADGRAHDGARIEGIAHRLSRRGAATDGGDGDVDAVAPACDPALEAARPRREDLGRQHRRQRRLIAGGATLDPHLQRSGPQRDGLTAARIDTEHAAVDLERTAIRACRHPRHRRGRVLFRRGRHREHHPGPLALALALAFPFPFALTFSFTLAFALALALAFAFALADVTDDADAGGAALALRAAVVVGAADLEGRGADAADKRPQGEGGGKQHAHGQRLAGGPAVPRPVVRPVRSGPGRVRSAGIPLDAKAGAGALHRGL